MLENGRGVKDGAGESCIGRMAPIMKGNGLKIVLMEKEGSFTLMAIST